MIEFFDSYAKDPQIYSLPINISITLFFSIVLQYFNSHVCGNYCILFLYYRAQNNLFDRTINTLNSITDSTIYYKKVSSLDKLQKICNTSLFHGQCSKKKCFTCYTLKC